MKLYLVREGGGALPGGGQASAEGRDAVTAVVGKMLPRGAGIHCLCRRSSGRSPVLSITKQSSASLTEAPQRMVQEMSSVGVWQRCEARRERRSSAPVGWDPAAHMEVSSRPTRSF